MRSGPALSFHGEQNISANIAEEDIVEVDTAEEDIVGTVDQVDAAAG